MKKVEGKKKSDLDESCLYKCTQFASYHVRFVGA